MRVGRGGIVRPVGVVGGIRQRGEIVAHAGVEVGPKLSIDAEGGRGQADVGKSEGVQRGVVVGRHGQPGQGGTAHLDGGRASDLCPIGPIDTVIAAELVARPNHFDPYGRGNPGDLRVGRRGARRGAKLRIDTLGRGGGHKCIDSPGGGVVAERHARFGPAGAWIGVLHAGDLRNDCAVAIEALAGEVALVGCSPDVRAAAGDGPSAIGIRRGTGVRRRSDVRVAPTWRQTGAGGRQTGEKENQGQQHGSVQPQASHP